MPILPVPGDMVYALVGHHHIGQELLELAHRLGVSESEFFLDQAAAYAVPVPAFGLYLKLKKLSAPQSFPQDAWALEGATLIASSGASFGGNDWAGPWPLGINPEAFTYDQALDVLGLRSSANSYQAPTRQERSTTFFPKGPRGAFLTVAPTWTPALQRLEKLELGHMGNTTPPRN